MSRVHPSLILHADIDEREHSDELAATIKRSYAYISPTVVKTHTSDAEDVENVLRYDVRLYCDYWDENDPDAAAQWDEVMPKWLHNMFNKVSSTITASNKTSASHGTRPLYYAWTELQFGDNVIFAFKTKQDCSLDDTYLEFVETGRHLMNAGDLGEGVAVIRVPSRASYEEQKAAIVAERQAAEEAAKLAREQAEDEDGQMTEDADASAAQLHEVADISVPSQGAGEGTSAAVAGQESAEGGAAANEGATADRGPAADGVEGEEGEQLPPELPHVNFDPDTTIWGIEYADGTVREFNSATRAFEM